MNGHLLILGIFMEKFKIQLNRSGIQRNSQIKMPSLGFTHTTDSSDRQASFRFLTLRCSLNNYKYGYIQTLRAQNTSHL